MPNVYIVKCATSGKRLGAALESNGYYLSHPFEEGEDTSDENTLNAVRSVGVPPAVLFDAFGWTVTEVMERYQERSDGEHIALEHIGVL